MALQKGEKYSCPDPNCGCEIEVTKGAKPGAATSTRVVAVERNAAGFEECERTLAGGNEEECPVIEHLEVKS